jgi:hypothetical protein
MDPFKLIEQHMLSVMPTVSMEIDKKTDAVLPLAKFFLKISQKRNNIKITIMVTVI